MAAVSVRNLEALVKLATKLVSRVLSRPFTPPATAEDVLALYAADRVAAVLEEERVWAPNVRRCTGCGRCDPVLDSGPAPSLLLLRLAREGQDAAGAIDAVRRLEPVARAIEAVCPEHVDVVAMLAQIRRRTLSERKK
jgi:hypothetical protein